MSEPPKEIEELLQEKKDDPTHLIPKPYVIKNGSLFIEKMVKRNGEETTETYQITTTPPFITERNRDIESGEVSYLLEFNDGYNHVKRNVQAKDITQRNELRNLASIGLDVDDETVRSLLKYLTLFRRMNPPHNVNVATRLGHIDQHFIHPLLENEVKLITYESGYKAIIDNFKSKGALKDYADNVFRPIINSPMAMMLLYASTGSILLHDFNVEPFIVDLSGKSSKGKTTALKVASSVYGHNLYSEWNTTRVGVERKAVFMNSFPLLLDDSRKANQYMIPDIIYQFSGGRSKGRGNLKAIQDEKTFQNILISTGETSLVNYGDEKGGIGARIITLQDNPFSEDVDFTALYDSLNANYGTLGIAYIEQYQNNKERYYQAFRKYEQFFINKAENNEIMQRLGRAFAVLLTSGEIISDIQGFEHDHYSIVDTAYNSLQEQNKAIDKPKQLLEGLLEKLDSDRSHITGANYGEVFNGSVKAVFNKGYLCVLTNTARDYLGHELHTITTEWRERDYLVTGNERTVKQVKNNGTSYRGYAIKTNVIEELGFDFKKEKY